MSHKWIPLTWDSRLGKAGWTSVQVRKCSLCPFLSIRWAHGNKNGDNYVGVMSCLDQFWDNWVLANMYCLHIQRKVVWTWSDFKFEINPWCLQKRLASSAKQILLRIWLILANVLLLKAADVIIIEYNYNGSPNYYGTPFKTLWKSVEMRFRRIIS